MSVCLFNIFTSNWLVATIPVSMRCCSSTRQVVGQSNVQINAPFTELQHALTPTGTCNTYSRCIPECSVLQHRYVHVYRPRARTRGLDCMLVHFIQAGTRREVFISSLHFTIFLLEQHVVHFFLSHEDPLFLCCLFELKQAEYCVTCCLSPDEDRLTTLIDKLAIKQ